MTSKQKIITLLCCCCSSQLWAFFYLFVFTALNFFFFFWFIFSAPIIPASTCSKQLYATCQAPYGRWSAQLLQVNIQQSQIFPTGVSTEAYSCFYLCMAPTLFVAPAWGFFFFYALKVITLYLNHNCLQQPFNIRLNYLPLKCCVFVSI